MFKKTLTPRISELNGGRHIGHHVIPVWLEEGYIEIIKLFNPDLQKRETNLFLVNTNIDYLHEMILGIDVEVITGVKKIGKTSIVLDQKILQAGKVCAKGASTLVSTSPDSKKPVSIPPAIIEKLREHLLEE